VLLRKLQRLLSLELLRGPEHLLGATGTGGLRRQRHGWREALVVRVLAAGESFAIAFATAYASLNSPPPFALLRSHSLPS